MEQAENENKAAGAPSGLNGGLSGILRSPYGYMTVYPCKLEDITKDTPHRRFYNGDRIKLGKLVGAEDWEHEVPEHWIVSDNEC